jgi:hypothetical protein
MPNFTALVFFTACVVCLGGLCVDGIRTNYVFRAESTVFYFLFRKFGLVEIINILIHHRELHDICFRFLQKNHLKLARTFGVFGVVDVVEVCFNLSTFPFDFISFNRERGSFLVMHQTQGYIAFVIPPFHLLLGEKLRGSH